MEEASEKNFERSDAGRDDCAPHEKNDCTVRAYANAFDIPYYQAHKEFKDFGRVDQKGFKSKPFFQWKGCNIIDHRGTVARFLKEHKEGSYICRIRHHLFAVKQGKVFDTSYGYQRARINWFVKVNDKKGD